MRPDSITLAIFEKYKPEEFAEVAKQMVAAQVEMETAENEKKTSDSVFNERIKKHAASVSELAQKYSKGGETAQIGCHIRYDIPSPGKKSYVRMDTEQIVETHDMTSEEKQETFQFPLTATEANPEKAKPQEKPVEETQTPPAETPAAPATEEPTVTYKDIQSVASHIAKLAEEQRQAQIKAATVWIAARIMRAGKVIAPDGRVEIVSEPGVADKLTGAYLALAIDEILKPKPAEEVTQMCPYPGCIDFAMHDGEHRFPPNVEPGEKATDTAAELQAQKEEKPKRRRRTKLMGEDAILPDPRKPSDPPEGAQA